MRQPGANLVTERLDFGTMLRQFVQRRADLPGGQTVQWQVEAPEEVFVLCDPSAARTIIENLADNAVKYGATTDRLRLATAARQVELSVIDDGMGFDPDRAESLFRAFGRGNSGKAVARAGSGLGLHISRTLAERMGGRLKASSEGDGKGATFRLTLPWSGPDADGGVTS
jgi:signal transduction histidine kinase